MDELKIKALTFDVFGTVVDWRSGVAREGRELGERKAIDADWEKFADAWRARYGPSMEEVRSGRRSWVNLDTLHRETLRAVLEEFGISSLSEEEGDYFSRAWHRLDPWPDVLPGLNRLKQKYILVTLSNGNVALMVNMAKRAGLPWDAVLGAEVVRHYKPQPEVYLGAAELLGLTPQECLMVAAHPADLVAARGCGFQTAFVPRPAEFGPNAPPNPPSTGQFDIVAANFLDLAGQLGC